MYTLRYFVAYPPLPCLYVARPDWPEARDLDRWIEETGVGSAVAPADLRSGDWLPLAERAAANPPSPLRLNGDRVAADLILSAFDLDG